MSKSIPISPKHGLNPTIPVCFFCGEEKNEIALLGKIKTKVRGEDPEAPRRCVLDYQPCEKCLKKMSMGVSLIEVTSTPFPDNRPPIDPKRHLYPTGRFCVLKPQPAREIFNDETLCENSRLFVEEGIIQQLMPPTEE